MANDGFTAKFTLLSFTAEVLVAAGVTVEAAAMVSAVVRSLEVEERDTLDEEGTTTDPYEYAFTSGPPLIAIP